MGYDVIDIPSQNFDDRAGTPIQLIVVHCIGLDLEATIRGLTRKTGEDGGRGVSAHYLIPQITAREFLSRYSGMIEGALPSVLYPDAVPALRLVPEPLRAWHAGVSSWGDFNKLSGCERSLNSCSIGIEFHAPGYDDELVRFAPFTKAQIVTGARLMQDRCKRHALNPKNILGHSDIAPWRPPGSGKLKTDPGPLFPWRFLYETYQLGFWPFSESSEGGGALDLDKIPPHDLKKMLITLGYKLSEGGEWTLSDDHVLDAFRMHFMPDDYMLNLCLT
jgi:N-acetyl-anhydromuramyl-L-alanine amidase AmpD